MAWWFGGLFYGGFNHQGTKAPSGRQASASRQEKKFLAKAPRRKAFQPLLPSGWSATVGGWQTARPQRPVSLHLLGGFAPWRETRQNGRLEREPAEEPAGRASLSDDRGALSDVKVALSDVNGHFRT